MPLPPLIIPAWLPARASDLDDLDRPQRWRQRRADWEAIGDRARVSGIPPATGRRRVSLVVTLTPRMKPGAAGDYWRNVLDGLVACGLLVEAGPRGCERGGVVLLRGPVRQTAVFLEDRP